MSDLSSLEPQVLWNYFLELSRIPRSSRNEAAASRWAAEQGHALGLDVQLDRVGNVLLRKPASPGKQARAAVALQAHLDMVCEKNEGTQHDFLRDPIRVVREGDLLHAEGTTLGADNGVGVAAALAVLADPNLSHPALEVLFTVDEETGLSGAAALQPGWLQAPRLLNLDSEDDRELTIGCAGGVDTTAARAVAFVPVLPGRRALRLKLHGLRGGHSGIDIAANRGNALRLLGQVLAALKREHELQLGEIRGGNKRNAIPREAWAVLHVSNEHEMRLKASVERLELEWRAALAGFEPNLALSLDRLEATDQRCGRALAATDAAAVVDFLLAAPHGVEAMSPHIADLVQTSTNLAVAETSESEVSVSFLTRSSLESSKASLLDRIAAAARLAGFRSECASDYPGWNPDPGANLVNQVNAVHRELFGESMLIKAIHAGLECGIIGRKYPGMEMASIGPSMWDVHTPDERVSITSVQRFWRLLTNILDRI